MSDFIKKILKEAAVDQHAIERLTDRFLGFEPLNVGYETAPGIYQVVGTYELSQQVKDIIKDRIGMIESQSFPKNKSYGVKIIDINIDKNKVKYSDTDFIEKAKRETLVFVDSNTQSNGNVVYGIIRENALITVYFGKSYVPQTKEKMRVDFIISDIQKAVQKQSIR